MATLYISEYLNMARDQHWQSVPVGEEPAIASQNISIGGASVQSAALDVKTRFVRLHSDAICSYKLGAAPVATTSDARMVAGATEYFGINKLAVETGLKIAVIINT